jgi:hypothetical protein
MVLDGFRPVMMHAFGQTGHFDFFTRDNFLAKFPAVRYETVGKKPDRKTARHFGRWQGAVKEGSNLPD